MKLTKIAALICFMMPMSAFAEYRIHIPMTQEFKGSLPNNSIVFTDKPNSENGNNSGSHEGDLELSENNGGKCAFNANNYVAEEVTPNFVYTYEWKSTYFSVPLTRETGYSSTLFYNNMFYSLYWVEDAPQEIVGTGDDRITKSYYKICQYEEPLG